jgi:hypothetical protein
MGCIDLEVPSESEGKPEKLAKKKITSMGIVPCLLPMLPIICTLFVIFS